MYFAVFALKEKIIGIELQDSTKNDNFANGMKLIVMTKPTFFVEEDKILEALFEEGLNDLHLYKPGSAPVYAERLLSLLPEELRADYEPVLKIADPEIHRLVKAADKLSAYIKCVEELKAGNAEFRRAAEQTRAALEEMHLQELDYFMEHCLSSFSRTLDELE